MEGNPDVDVPDVDVPEMETAPWPMLSESNDCGCDEYLVVLSKICECNLLDTCEELIELPLEAL